MTAEQRRHFTLIKDAANYKGASDFIREGAPLKLNIEEDKMVVVIGAITPTGFAGNTITSAYIELNPETGEAEFLLRP